MSKDERNGATMRAVKGGRILSAVERRRLAGATRVDPRTILRWERGERVQDSVKLLLEMVARRLRFPLPMAQPKPNGSAT